MGPSTDPSAVDDPELKVHNITGLRVVADASVMPYVISGNTNAPTVKYSVPQVNNLKKKLIFNLIKFLDNDRTKGIRYDQKCVEQWKISFELTVDWTK